MSGITSEFVKTIASIWHRFSLGNEEAKTLTNMLAPMDDVLNAVGMDDLAEELKKGEKVSSIIHDYIEKFEIDNSKFKFLNNGMFGFMSHESIKYFDSIEIETKKDFDIEDEDERFVRFYALKKIKQGEEILHDYGEDYWESRDAETK